MINRIISLAIGFVVGVVTATFFNLNVPFLALFCHAATAAALALTVHSLVLERKWIESSKAMILIPPMIAGLALGIVRASAVIHSTSPATRFFESLEKDEMFDFKGAIVAEPERRGPRTLVLRVRLSALKKRGDSAWIPIAGEDVRVYFAKPRSKAKSAIFAELSDSRAYGDVVTATASWTPIPDRRSSGGFDMRAFLLAEGCVAEIRVNDWRKRGALRGEITAVEKGDGFFLMEWALAAKRSFIATYCRSIPSPESRLVSGATLGARFALRGREYRGALIEDVFRRAGVGHVLAVSGLHVSVVSLLLFSLFRLTRIPPKYFAPLLVLLLFIFTLLTGARPSSLRATIMNAVIILTFVYAGSGFERATYAGLAVSALLILFRRPMALYSAGFLLSFGAVLSLVLISPPVERLLRQLRGAVFAFALLWCAGVVAFALTRWDLFLNWNVLAILAVLLAALLHLGASINARFPAILAFRFDRLPRAAGMFLAAQLAIQIGMMIPMSACFFGNFPIAGMFVNLIAIPLVGILVQLGILTGVAGAVPIAGPYLALVFGAANYLVARVFIFIAWLGSVAFPYPPTPKPSVTWMLTYYAVIAAALVSRLWLPKARTLLYAVSAKKPQLVPVASAAAAILTGGCAVFNLNTPREAEPVFDLLEGASTPVVVVTGLPDGALIINSGGSFLASGPLRNLLLSRGEVKISTAVATGRSPADGAEGFAKLAEKIPIERVVYPAFVDPPAGPLELPSDADKAYEAYLKAIGMRRRFSSRWKAKNKRRGGMSRKPLRSRWVLRSLNAYRKLLASPAGKSLAFKSYPTVLKLADGVVCDIIAPVKGTYPAPVMLTLGSKRILIVGDPANRGLAELAPGKIACDELVLAAPTSLRAKFYFNGLKALLAKIAPKKITLCVDTSRMSASRERAVAKCAAMCAAFNFTTTAPEQR